MNTSPQVDSLLERLSGPRSEAQGVWGPSWRSGTTIGYAFEDTSGKIPRPIHRRLSTDQRTALVTAFASGAKQKDLAIEYGISIRSVKRLVRAWRDVGWI